MKFQPYLSTHGLQLAGTLASLALLTGPDTSALAQGCVAVRGTGMCVLHGVEGARPEDVGLEGGGILVSVAYRYLDSHRHFVGDDEQTQRQLVQANEVINHSHFIDAAVQYAFTPRYSVALVLPYVTSTRSQKAPAGYPTYRYETEASGFGDARLSGYMWIWDPTKVTKANLQVGLGLKMPTGEDGAADTFPTANGPVYKTVDQSIQPGDGGWGFSTELNGYWEFLPRTVAYLQGFYLFNPERDNGQLTWRDNNTAIPGNVTAMPSSASYYEHFMSIPDQYFGRLGIAYTILPKWGLSIGVGGRVEGIPVHDFLGDSEQFRRPGIVIGIEPSIQVMKGRWTVNVSVPFALYRNRERSVADKTASDYRLANPVPGQNPDVHGDAAFADYLISASIAYRF
jgi:hypothetical protein